MTTSVIKSALTPFIFLVVTFWAVLTYIWFFGGLLLNYLVIVSPKAIKRCFELVLTIWLCVFWTSLVCVRLSLDLLFGNGWKAFSYTKTRPNPPSVLLDGWSHNFVEISPAIKLHYVSNGSADKPLMLLLHGFPEFWYSWRHQIREFGKDYRVVALDMRGYGQSSKPEGRFNYNVENLGQDVIDVVRTLVGHDWGGAAAWHVALHAPEIVDKLIIMNCPQLEVFEKYLKSSFTQLLKAWYMFFFQCPYLPELYMRSYDYKFLASLFKGKRAGCTNRNAFTDQDIEAWKYTFSQPGAFTPPVNYLRAVFTRLTKPPTPNSFVVEAPTLIIWGTRDVALETELAQLSAKMCRQATVQLIEGASHWIQQDEPELCNKYMKQFLTED